MRKYNAKFNNFNRGNLDKARLHLRKAAHNQHSASYSQTDMGVDEFAQSFCNAADVLENLNIPEAMDVELMTIIYETLGL